MQEGPSRDTGGGMGDVLDPKLAPRKPGEEPDPLLLREWSSWLPSSFLTLDEAVTAPGETFILEVQDEVVRSEIDTVL